MVAGSEAAQASSCIGAPQLCQAELPAFDLDQEGRALIIAVVIGLAHVRQPIVEIDVLPSLECVPQGRAKFDCARLCHLQRIRRSFSDQRDDIPEVSSEHVGLLPVCRFIRGHELLRRATKRISRGEVGGNGKGLAREYGTFDVRATKLDEFLTGHAVSLKYLPGVSALAERLL